MSVKVGDRVKFCDGTLNGEGIVREISHKSTLQPILVELQGDLRGKGHNGTANTFVSPYEANYWWIDEWSIVK